MVRHHHHHHHAARNRAAMALLLDQQLLAVPPGQQVLYEDSYSHALKTFNTSIAPNLLQSYSLGDGQLFTETMNSLNTYLDTTVGEMKSKYMMIMLINILLILLTLGLWMFVFIFVMFYMMYQQQQKQLEVQQEVNKMFQKLNTSQLTGNSLEWKLIQLSTGFVVRLVYTGAANLTMPPQQQPYGQPMMMNQQPMMVPPQQQQQYMVTPSSAMNQPGMVTQPVTLQPVSNGI